MRMCSDCGKEVIDPKEFYKYHCKCYSCYAIKELHECNTCGRQLAYMDAYYNGGLCDECYEN